MVTFSDLRSLDAKPLQSAAQAWRDHAESMREFAQRMNADVAGALLRSGWRGEAATLAVDRSENIEDYFDVRSHTSELVASVYDTAYERLWRLQWRLVAAVGEAERAGLTVRDDGVVEPPPVDPVELHDPDGRAAAREREQRARELTERIAGIVREADEVDRQTASALVGTSPETRIFAKAGWDELSVDAGSIARMYGLSADDVPTGDPERAARWWDRLSHAQQQFYLMAFPAAIGATDGLPVEVRDRANRLALRRAGGDRAQVLLQRLEESEHWPEQQRLRLLAFDLAADGKAVIAVGNPDTADHTAVYVPGVGTTIDNIGGDIARVRDLQERADALTYGRTGDVATVMWLGYDTPGVDLSAVRGAHAEAGAPALDSFIDGLRSSHQGSGHVTVVGHSYGSTVVGTAASTGDGLAVDDIIVAGSPGMRVGHVSDLQIDPRHVWAGAAKGDDVTGWMSHFAHGPEPHKEGFGANRFEVDTTGHSDYWKRGSESLDNQAAIVVGRYELVDLEHGERPR
ncbi:MAG: alpha/beta hydrolase [Micromonosporaceae bacterium]|jgi:hypothetical protein